MNSITNLQYCGEAKYCEGESSDLWTEPIEAA